MPETSPYLNILQGQETREADMVRTINDRGRMAIALFVLLTASLYGNVYQLTQAKVIPYIHTVNEHGETVTRLLVRPGELPQDNPWRAAMQRTYIKNWVKNARIRSMDKKLTAVGINSALRATKGPGLQKLRMEITAEDVFTRIKKETVEVKMPKNPLHVAGETWQAEWEEISYGNNNVEAKRQYYSGAFQLVEREEWVTAENPLGLGVVSWNVEPFGK